MELLLTPTRVASAACVNPICFRRRRSSAPVMSFDYTNWIAQRQGFRLDWVGRGATRVRALIHASGDKGHAPMVFPTVTEGSSLGANELIDPCLRQSQALGYLCGPE